MLDKFQKGYVPVMLVPVVYGDKGVCIALLRVFDKRFVPLPAFLVREAIHNIGVAENGHCRSRPPDKTT